MHKEHKPTMGWRDYLFAGLGFLAEALAVIYGIAVLTLFSAGLFWFAWRSYQHEKGDRITWKSGVKSAVILIVLTTVLPIGGKKYFERTEQPQIYIRGSGFRAHTLAEPPYHAYVTIFCYSADKNYGETRRFAVLMRLEDNTVDRFQDTRIERSPAYLIVNGETEVDMKIPQDFYQRAIDASNGRAFTLGVDLALVVVPKDLDLGKIVSFSQVKDVGGALVEVRNVNGVFAR